MVEVCDRDSQVCTHLRHRGWWSNCTHTHTNTHTRAHTHTNDTARARKFEVNRQEANVSARRGAGVQSRASQRACCTCTSLREVLDSACPHKFCACMCMSWLMASHIMLNWAAPCMCMCAYLPALSATTMPSSATAHPTVSDTIAMSLRQHRQCTRL